MKVFFRPKISAGPRGLGGSEREVLDEILASDTSGACGIAAVQSARGATREVVEILLESLCANDIRGGANPELLGIPTGDGAGLTLRTDDDFAGRGMQRFLHSKVGRVVPIPRNGEQLHIGSFFIDSEERANTDIIGRRVSAILASEGLEPLKWRTVDTNPSSVSARARAIMPLIHQLIYAEGDVSTGELRRALFNARLRIRNELQSTHIVSLEPGTVVYKGMCRGEDLPKLYPDLQSEAVVTDAGVSHTRFGTNVLAHWRLAQGFPLVAHNGEVNSIKIILQGLNALERRNALPGSNIMRGGSDSANLDRALQMLHSFGGLSLPEAVRFLMHPAHDDLEKMDEETRLYFRAVQRTLGSLKVVGPAAVLALDRDHLTATLDNMGLRPLRWVEREDGLVVISSEVGSPRVPEERIMRYGRLGPGQHMFLERGGRLVGPGESDPEIIRHSALNFRDFAQQEIIRLDSAERSPEAMARAHETRIKRSHLFGLNRDRLITLKKTIEAKKDPVEGMGSDCAMPILTGEPHSIGRYLRPDYAQVTNPALDQRNEGKAFSLRTLLGRRPKQKIFAKNYEARAQYEIDSPLMDDTQMACLFASPEGSRPAVREISTVLPGSPEGFKAHLSGIKATVLQCASTRTHSIIVLSDRLATSYIPPHLLVSYLKKALANEGLDEFVSLVVDTGEVWDQHEYAMLISCGADAVHPRMIYEYIDAKSIDKKGDMALMKDALKSAFNFTLLRYMSKVGCTEIEEYKGGRQFSTLGLDTAFVQRYFGDIPTNGGGRTLEKILSDQARRASDDSKGLRGEDERHAYAKSVYLALQEVGESESLTPEAAYKKYLEAIDAQGPMSFNDLLRFKTNGNGVKRKPIPIDQVMSKEDIIRYLMRGASMSLGALNDVSHKAVHLLFNEYGSFANSGEGGTTRDRMPDGAWEAAVCKGVQIASGRFGVDAEFLANPLVRRIEIKIGQGAKPGVGGHLPGEKVPWLVAEIRGVGLGQELISPPTNHNIYSIEDLKAFIGHLSALNPVAEISVKLTSGAHVGNISVGVTKAGADVVQVSGDRGSTGAATYTDKYQTGLPTELGVASVDKALIERGIRGRVRIGADGGIRTGADILKLIMQGADEVALGVAILIAQQKCVFCSSCNNQKCPSDICRTRSEFLGSKKGKNRTAYPGNDQMDRLLDAGSHFLELMAEEIREHMAALGVRHIEELQGKREFLEIDPRYAREAQGLDMSGLLETPKPKFKELFGVPETLEHRFHHSPRLRKVVDRVMDVASRVVRSSKNDPERIEYYLNHPSVSGKNREILRTVNERGGEHRVRVPLKLRAQDRSIGATLFGVLVKKVMRPPPGGVLIASEGEAGQGYGFALMKGVTMRHSGVVQNEAGEIQSGGRLIIVPPKQSRLAGKNDLALVGNTLGYGARGGDRFIRASIGDRGCIRETGGRTIITGSTGKYFAEYKTGGRDIVLGTLGQEVGAGMSGGELYSRDPKVAEKLADGVQVAPILRAKDRVRIKADLEEFHAETGDSEVAEMLLNWQRHQHTFKKVVSEGSYATKVFQHVYRHIESGGHNVTVLRGTVDNELVSDLFEMCGYDSDVSTGPHSVDQMKDALKDGLSELRAAITARELTEPEEIFMFVGKWAKELTAEIRNDFIIPASATAESVTASTEAVT